MTGGVARRAWARNQNSIAVAMEHNEKHGDLDQITVPYLASDDLTEKLVKEALEHQ